jgi:uncharacterized protein
MQPIGCALEEANPMASVRSFVKRHPVASSLSIYVLEVLLVLALIMQPSLPGTPLYLGVLVLECLAAIGIVAALGWWKLAGLTYRPNLRALVPYLSLIPMAITLPALMVFAGATTDSLTIIIVVFSALMIGITEETLFRGVILHALLPKGVLRAALVSTALFTAAHLINLIYGADLTYIGIQMAIAAFIGFWFAALKLKTGTILPLVLMHALIDTVSSLTNLTEWTPMVLGIVILIGLELVGSAVYGAWLLRSRRDSLARPVSKATV